MDLKRMKGLIEKEWTLLKWGIITLFLLNIVVVLAVPPLVNRAFGLPLNAFEHSLVLSGTWFVFNLFMSVGILITSLGHEMKQQEVWLHSPAPMLQLVGVKAAFAVIVTGGLIALGGVLLTISFLSSDALGTIAKTDGALSLLSVMIAIFLKSIFIMGVGFFSWSIYQVVRSRTTTNVPGFAKFLLFILGVFTALFISTNYWLLNKLSKIFAPILEFGPIKFTDATFYNEQSSYLFMGIVPEGVVFTIGGLIFYGMLTLVLFVAGSTLFEKKVRL